MGMQKYRADISAEQPDGAIVWSTRWLGGPSIARVNKCRVDGVAYRLTVYPHGQPDTWFSQPAAAMRKGKYIKGYLTTDDDGYIFHAMDSHKHLL